MDGHTCLCYGHVYTWVEAWVHTALTCVLVVRAHPSPALPCTATATASPTSSPSPSSSLAAIGDRYADATSVVAGVTYTGSTLGAGPEPGEPPGNGPLKSIWYKYTVPAPGGCVKVCGPVACVVCAVYIVYIVPCMLKVCCPVVVSCVSCLSCMPCTSCRAC
jgi:hypothetical protein